MVAASGGTTTAIHDFQQTLGGGIVSFTNPSHIGEESRSVLHLATVRGPAGSHYAWISRDSRRALVENIRHSELVVIHGLFRLHAQIAATAAERAGVPYWVVPHGSLDPWVFSYRSVQKHSWMSLVGNRVLRRADRVIFASRLEQQKAKDFVPAIRSEVIHWPVDYSDKGRRAMSGSRLRERLGIPATARVLLFLGRLHPMKRVSALIDVFGRSGVPDLHLIVAGPDSPEQTRSACISYAEERGIERLHLLGPVYDAEKEEVFASADGFVSLSRRENFGYTVAEAAIRGIPVILSPGNALAAPLGEHRGGWILESDALEEAISAVREFATCSEDDLRGMGSRAREWASRELTREAFASRLSELAGATLRPFAGRAGRQ